MNNLHNNHETKSKLDWVALRRQQSNPKLSDVCSDAKHVFDSYYQISDSEYCFASYQWNSTFTEEAVFILAFFWAPTPTIFRRMVSRDPEVIAADDGTTRILPDGLRLSSGCDTFRAITEFCARKSNVHFRLIDLYDNKMERSGCCLSVWRLHYYFRSPSPVPPDELPYGVNLAASDLLLKKTD